MTAGAALGSSFGSVAQRVGAATGYSVVQPQAYALVGVAALLAGTCQVGVQWLPHSTDAVMHTCLR